MDIYDALQQSVKTDKLEGSLNWSGYRWSAEDGVGLASSSASIVTGEMPHEKSSVELANEATALLSSARRSAQRLERQMKENEEQKQCLFAELGRINDLIGRLEERKALTGSAQKSAG